MQAGANALHPHERKDPTLTLLHEACFLEDEDASLDIAMQVLPTPPPPLIAPATLLTLRVPVSALSDTFAPVGCAANLKRGVR